MASVTWVRGVPDAATLRDLRSRGVQNLAVSDQEGFEGDSLNFLRELPDVRRLVVQIYTPIDASPILSCQGLEQLVLNIEPLQDIVDLASLRRLRELTLEYTSKLHGIEGLTNLEYLEISRPRLQDLRILASLPKLRCLRLGGARQLQSLVHDTTEHPLHTLEVQGAPFNSLDPLRHLSRLKDLILAWCKNVHTLNPLADNRALRELVLEDCGAIESLGPLRESSLERILLIGGTQIEDGKIAWLGDVPSLREAVFVNRRHYDASLTSVQWRLRRRRFTSKLGLR